MNVLTRGSCFAKIDLILFRTVRRCSEGKSDGAHEQDVRRGPAMPALLPTVEDSHRAIYRSEKEVHRS